MKYVIDQFIVVNLENSAAIQNSTGLNIIHDEHLKKFFTLIDESNRLYIDDNFLFDFFGKKTDSVLKFLIEKKMIYTIPEKQTYKEIEFFTNSDIMYSSISFHSKNSNLPSRVNLCDSYDNMFKQINTVKPTENKLIVVVLNPFDYINFIKISDLLHNLNVPHCISFCYNSRMYISNIHKKEWHNPCPKCFFSLIESSLRTYNKMTSAITFQNIIDLIYNKKVDYNPEIPLNYRNSLVITYRLFKFDKFDININDLSKTTEEVSLDDQITFDNAIHWEICDCFE